MMSFTEEIVKKAALDLTWKDRNITYGDNVINFNPPFKRISMTDAIKENTGIDISVMDEAGLRAVCDKLDVPNTPSMGKGKLIDELFGAKCEHNYIQPTFIIDYPTETSPLTKMHRSKPGVTERFELLINGKEWQMPILN
jgi:lysyl-tRNA synthetase class 2